MYLLVICCKYRVIKKSLCTWWLQYRKLQVMSKVSPASLQKFAVTPNCVLYDRVQYSTVHIPNVFCDGHLQLIFVLCTVIAFTETYWSPCINPVQPLIQRVPGFSPGGKAAGAWVWPPPPFTPQVKNGRSYTSTSPVDNDNSKIRNDDVISHTADIRPFCRSQ